jgi:hypothetical protein
VEKLNHRPVKRVPTRATKGAKERTLEAKTRRARLKRSRSKPGADE